MKQNRSYIIFWVAKLPLLLLYASFFIVQLFYNFDIANHASNATHKTVAKVDAQKNNSSFVKKAGLPVEKKGVFRLNKRYHPQPAVSCNGVIIKPIICCVSSKLHIHYSSGFAPSSFPPAHALRGPPAVV